MNSLKNFSAYVVALFVLAACSHNVWMKPGAGPNDFGADNYACTQSAAAQAPPIIASSTNYSGGLSTFNAAQRSASGTMIGPTVQTRTQDVNEKLRMQLINSCLQSKGWQLTSVSD